MTKQDYKSIAKSYYDGYQALKRVSLEMAEELDVTGEKLKEYLLKCENRNYVDETEGFSVDYVEEQSVSWDVDSLEKQVPVYVSREVVKKKLAVDNEIMFVALLNRFKVPMDEFWRCVTVEKKVDAKKLEQLIDTGEVTKDMLDGTFKIVTKKEYIKVTEQKQEQKL